MKYVAGVGMHVDMTVYAFGSLFILRRFGVVMGGTDPAALQVSEYGTLTPHNPTGHKWWTCDFGVPDEIVSR